MGGCCEVPPMLWPGIQPIPLPWAQGGRLHLGHRHRERVMGRAARSIPTPTFERIGGLHPSCGHSPAPPVVSSPRVPHPGADCPRRAASPLLVPREGGTGSPFPSGLAPLKAGTSPLSPPAQTPRRGERAVLSPHGDTFPALPPRHPRHAPLVTRCSPSTSSGPMSAFRPSSSSVLAAAAPAPPLFFTFMAPPPPPV